MTWGHFDHPIQYTLTYLLPAAAPDFTDIKKYDDGTYAIPPRMKDYNFPLRKLNGDFYAQVFPFDPLFFYTKYTSFHSPLTLLQHLCIHFEYAKKPLQLLSDVPKYWLEEDGNMCLDEGHRWRSVHTLKWLSIHGLSSVPRSIVTLVHESPLRISLFSSCPVSLCSWPGGACVLWLPLVCCYSSVPSYVECS